MEHAIEVGSAAIMHIPCYMMIGSGIQKIILVVKGITHVARMGEKRNAYKIFVGKPEGKKPLGRPRRRLVDNIKVDLREIGWDDINWIDLAQDRDQWRALVNTIMNLRVPLNVGKFLSSCRIGGFSRRAQLHDCYVFYKLRRLI
jgi:hypothetical protein